MTTLRPLGLMTLGLLRESDMHPYEMMRLLRQRKEDRLVPVRNGTFYHQISRLVQDGLIAEVGTDRDGNRPERTTYTLTPAGDDAITAWVRAHLGPAAKPGEFAVALAEAHNLPADEVATLLGARRDHQRAELADLTDALRIAYDRGVDRQYIVEAERSVVLLRADVDWATAFIDDLNLLHWGTPSPHHLSTKDLS